MTTHENRPATDTPDWTPCAGNRCANCEPRCNQCTGLVAAAPLTMPQLWDGED